MKCSTHNQDATAVCAHCGRAVCATCAPISSSPRTACSETCAQALAKNERAIDLILGRSAQMALASAYGCYLCGVILIVFAAIAYGRYQQARPAYVLAGVFGIAFIVFGAMYHRGARKKY